MSLDSIQALIIFHSGWGIAYFLKSIFPKTKSLHMLNGGLTGTLKSRLLIRPLPIHLNKSKIKTHNQLLNATQASEILRSDLVWTATQWQKQQFPGSIQSKISFSMRVLIQDFFSPEIKSSSITLLILPIHLERWSQ